MLLSKAAPILLPLHDILFVFQSPVLNISSIILPFFSSLYIFDTCFLDSSRFFPLCCSIDAANASGAGIVDKLFSRPNTKIILDEIEKMNKRDQNILLNLLEIGILRSTKVERPVVIHS